MIDEGKLSARARERLREDQVVWLTTVRPDGTPQATPVWFVWEGKTFLVYSQRGKPKLRNIASNPKVSLHFNSDPVGEDVLVLTAEATPDQAAPPMRDNGAYLEKYAEGIRGLGMTAESASEEYSEPIRIEPISFRSW